LIGLFRHLAIPMDVWVDSTLLRGAANKGSSKPHTTTRELQRICLFFGLSRSAGILCIRAVCGKPPQTAYHAVVFLHFRTWRGGGTCEGQRRGLVTGGNQSLPLRKKYIYIQCE
ncbi:retrotransposon hot spot (RHS) protein, partial [Trypanosoma cruzi]